MNVSVNTLPAFLMNVENNIANRMAAKSAAIAAGQANLIVWNNAINNLSFILTQPPISSRWTINDIVQDIKNVQCTFSLSLSESVASATNINTISFIIDCLNNNIYNSLTHEVYNYDTSETYYIQDFMANYFAVLLGNL